MYNLEQRIAVEKQLFTKVVDTLLAAGLTLRLYDGEDFATTYTKNRELLIREAMATDEDRIFVYDGDGVTGTRLGWVLFIYGNDGHDVISDYTVSLEQHIRPALDLADQLESQCS